MWLLIFAIVVPVAFLIAIVVIAKGAASIDQEIYGQPVDEIEEAGKQTLEAAYNIVNTHYMRWLK